MKPLDLGTHICHLYRKEDDLRDVALPFIGDGLRRGECCLYVPNGTAAADLDRELLAQGIDSAGARETGALAVILSDIWRDLCQQGSIALAREVLALMDSNLDAFDAVRIAGDFAWAKAPSVSADAQCGVPGASGTRYLSVRHRSLRARVHSCRAADASRNPVQGPPRQEPLL